MKKRIVIDCNKLLQIRELKTSIVPLYVHFAMGRASYTFYRHFGRYCLGLPLFTEVNFKVKKSTNINELKFISAQCYKNL